MAYQVPVPLREPAFSVPATLFTNGWVHVLEDTELTFILMMAACHHAVGGQEFRVPAEVRPLPHTLGFIPAGFERDAFTTLRAQIDYQLSR